MENHDELAQLTDDDLIARLNGGMSRHVSPGVDFYYQELARRQATRSADRMEQMTQTVVDLTKSIEGMTGTIKALTLWAVGASIAAVIVAVIALVAS